MPTASYARPSRRLQLQSSLPILPQPHAEPLLHTPYLVGVAIMVSPSDPLLAEIAAAQAGDSALSATIKTVLGRPSGGSNPALPHGSPSGRSEEEQFAFQGGILYHQGRILISPTAVALILKILRQYHDSPLAGHYGVARQWGSTSSGRGLLQLSRAT